MRVGITLPQGCDREYLGLDPRRAWERTVEVALEAEDLGFESLWVYDHMTVDPPPEPAPVFEPIAELAAIAASTRSARLGHLVLAAAYRNPGLTAKAISTIDVISGGRAELGIGAGWKEDEWVAYGYGYPPAAERLAILADHLEIVTRLFRDERATYEGRHAHVRDAIHEPKGLQDPRIPIVVGGNGPNVTWRLAARFADELNLDALPPADIAAALPVIAARCAEVGRDPTGLRVSVHVWGPAAGHPGRELRDRLTAYRDLGLARVILQGFAAVTDRGHLARIADDCAALGLLEAEVPAAGGRADRASVAAGQRRAPT